MTGTPENRCGIAAALLVAAMVAACSEEGGTIPQPRPAVEEEAPPEVAEAVNKACDALAGVAGRTPGTTTERSTGVYIDDGFAKQVTGCQVQVQGSFQKAAGKPAHENFHYALGARGMQEVPVFAADGKDGTVFAYRSREAACQVRAIWNAGAYGDAEAPSVQGDGAGFDPTGMRGAMESLGEAGFEPGRIAPSDLGEAGDVEDLEGVEDLELPEDVVDAEPGLPDGVEDLEPDAAAPGEPAAAAPSAAGDAAPAGAAGRGFRPGTGDDSDEARQVLLDVDGVAAAHGIDWYRVTAICAEEIVSEHEPGAHLTE